MDKNEKIEGLYQNPISPSEAYLKKFPETKPIEINYNPHDATIRGLMGMNKSWVGEEVPIIDGMIESYITFRDGLLKEDAVSGEIAGGVEPPAFLTSGDFAEGMSRMPRCIQELVLDPDELGNTDEVLGELERQGYEVAVAIERFRPVPVQPEERYVFDSTLFNRMSAVQDVFEKRLIFGVDSINIKTPNVTSTIAYPEP